MRPWAGVEASRGSGVSLVSRKDLCDQKGRMSRTVVIAYKCMQRVNDAWGRLPEEAEAVPGRQLRLRAEFSAPASGPCTDIYNLIKPF